jgi:hypothetical protein
VERRIDTAGAAHLQLVGDAPLLRPEAQAFEAMLDGWRAQQLSRNLSFATIDAGARVVRRFQEHAGTYPWQWSPGELEAWTAELRGVRRRAQSTVRSYQVALRSFLGYVCDPAYGWDGECLARFGTHSVQIFSDANRAAHVADYEGRPGRRSLTRAECQDLFDAADSATTRPTVGSAAAPGTT